MTIALSVVLGGPRRSRARVVGRKNGVFVCVLCVGDVRPGAQWAAIRKSRHHTVTREPGNILACTSHAECIVNIFVVQGMAKCGLFPWILERTIFDSSAKK